ncbi:MAG TPA: glycosyltransferase family 2 protein [Solirubrobacteraceae bacterium]|jgi:dolichol-phosphate mannosyltransferase
MKLSAVIACYGDALAVPIMHERLSRMFGEIGADYEVIFVNDGSPDNAGEVLAELADRDPKVVVVNHTRAFGSQGAFTSGMRIATGDAVVLLDGDLQDPPEVIPRFVEQWCEGFDIVYGVRVKRETTAFMRLAYKLFYRVFRRLSYVNIPLDAGDFGLIDRRVVNVLNDLPESHRFIRGLRAWVGFRQIGVPYVRPERVFGRSTNSLIKNLGWARRAIVSFSYVPLDLIAWLALVTVGVSFAGLVTQLLLRALDPSLAPKGFTTLIVGMLFIGGVQLLCVAIIGSYVAHIYEESKHRPPFLVESVLNDPAERLPDSGAPATVEVRSLKPERAPREPLKPGRPLRGSLQRGQTPRESRTPERTAQP